MKKYIYITIIISAMAVQSNFAQQIKVSKHPKLDISDCKEHPRQKSPIGSNKTVFTDFEWYSYPDAMNTYQTNQGNTPQFTRNGSYLFPDSLPIASFGGTYSAPWVHALTVIFDPKSPGIMTASGDVFYPNRVFYVDSMAMNLIYTRNMADTNIVDTLVINVMTNDKGTAVTNNFPIYKIDGTAYGITDLPFMEILFDTLSVMNNGKYDSIPRLIPRAESLQGDMITIKVPLTKADSSQADGNGDSFIKTIKWAVNNLEVNQSRKGKVIGAFITFKPGYTYQMGDSLHTLNYIRFFSDEEKDNDYQTYIPGDYNVSGILPQDVRYGLSPGNWNGNTIPSYAYEAPYAFEYHEVLWKVMPDIISITPVKDNDGNCLQNIYPNPVSSSSTITVPFTLSRAADVIFNVVDVQGRIINTGKPSKFNAGDNQIDFSTESLAAGLYYISMNINGGILTKPFSVIK